MQWVCSETTLPLLSVCNLPIQKVNTGHPSINSNWICLGFCFECEHLNLSGLMITSCELVPSTLMWRRDIKACHVRCRTQSGADAWVRSLAVSVSRVTEAPPSGDWCFQNSGSRAGERVSLKWCLGGIHGPDYLFCSTIRLATPTKINRGTAQNGE